MALKPMTTGTICAVAVHMAVVVVMAFIFMDVRPMTTPPLEVELMGMVAHPGEEEETRQAGLPSYTRPENMREEPTTDRFEEEVADTPLPELPASTSLERELVPPPLPSSQPSKPRQSPGSRLAPVPLEDTEGETSNGDVRVQVEGLLSTRRLIHLVRPIFPSDVKSGGEVRVRLTVASDGTVRRAMVIQKAHPTLEESSLHALRQWRFAEDVSSPTTEGVVTIRFRIQ